MWEGNLNYVFNLENACPGRLDEDGRYIAFILGRTFLKDGALSEADDLAYNECCGLAEIFMHTKFNNPDKSLYDCVEDYVKWLKMVAEVFPNDEL